MKNLQVLAWVVVCLLVAVAPSFGHCGKKHIVRVDEMSSVQLQQKLAEAEITSEALMFKKMMKAKEEKNKSLDELFNKLIKDK